MTRRPILALLILAALSAPPRAGSAEWPWPFGRRVSAPASSCPNGMCPAVRPTQAPTFMPHVFVPAVPSASAPVSAPATRPALPTPARAVAPAGSPALAAPAKVTAPAVADPLADALVTLNAGRARAGLPPFALDARLCRAAQVHSEDLASGRVDYGRDPHQGFPQRLISAGFPFTSGTLSEGVFPLTTGVDVGYWVNWLLLPAQAREAHSLDYRSTEHNTIGIGLASGSGSPYGGFLTIDYGMTDSPVPVTPTGPTPNPPVINPPPPNPTGKPLPPVNPPGKPTPPVTPSPQGPPADASALARGAKMYILGLPLELRGVASDVDGGKVADLDGLLAAIRAARTTAAKDMDTELAKTWAPLLQADGTIADRAGVARSIRTISDSMTEAITVGK